MAFFKPQQMKVNGQFYPVAVLVDRPMEIDELAEQIAEVSTVSKADIVAVFASLPSVMARGMNAGRSVHIQDVGYFRYTADAKKGGQPTAEEVTAADVARTRIRFTPETKFNTGRTATTRSLAPENVRWTKWGGGTVADPSEGTGTGSGSTGGNDDGDNPLG